MLVHSELICGKVGAGRGSCLDARYSMKIYLGAHLRVVLVEHGVVQIVRLGEPQTGATKQNSPTKEDRTTSSASASLFRHLEKRSTKTHSPLTTT